MSRTTKLRRGRLRAALLLAATSLASAALLAAPAHAGTPSYQDPGNVTITASPTDGLTNGTTINYTVNTTGGAKLQGPITTHLCKHITPVPTYSATTFGYSGSTANRCIYSAGITSQTGFAGADLEKVTSPFAGTETTSGPQTFVAGTGSITWGNVTGSGPFTAAADSSNPLDLVIQVNLTGGSVPVTYIVLPLSYAGQPGAPTSLLATAGDNSAHVTWSAPANTGNGTINHYHVVATPASGPVVTFDTLNATPVADLTLQNFSVYSIAVQTVISELPGTPSAAATVAGVNPLPPAPTGVSGLGGDGKVTVSWTAPVSTSTPTSYEVTAHDGTSALPDSVQCTGSTTPSYLFQPLANGTPWQFKVRAYYGSGACTNAALFGPFSGSSSGVTPTGFEIDQLIQVSRPTGALVLTQACDATYPRLTPGGTTRNPAFSAGDPYPQDPTTGATPNGDVLYPTPSVVAGTPGALGSCSVNLGAAKLITGPDSSAINPGAGYPSVFEGQFFKADGALHQVTVVNARETNEAFVINGKLAADFVDGTGDTLSGTSLGWQPVVTDKTPDFQTPGMATPYHNDTTKGADVLPANTPAGLGLKVAQPLASATHGLGEAHLDAALHILIPVTTAHGTYTALLQITAI